MPESPKLFFDPALSDPVCINSGIEKDHAERLYDFFKTHKLFRWKDANNDCEDRANAICILLDKWKIPNFKAWIFSGFFLQRDLGSLKNFWNYHVAVIVPVIENDAHRYYVIDPSTADAIILVEDWAENISSVPNSYYTITSGDTYIFCAGKISRDTWHKRNRQNYKWTIQGLAGINGVSKTGKAQLFFCRKKIIETEVRFKNLLENDPVK
jgi:hypothetical protein